MQDFVLLIIGIGKGGRIRSVMSKFLSVCEVADLLRVSTKWVYAHQNELKGRFKVAGLIRFDQEKLLKGLSEPKSKPVSDDRHQLL